VTSGRAWRGGGSGWTSGRQGWTDQAAVERGALDLSVIVRAFDEEASVGPLYQGIIEAVVPLGITSS
jgi:hypothetical protein